MLLKLHSTSAIPGEVSAANLRYLDFFVRIFGWTRAFTFLCYYHLVHDSGKPRKIAS